LDHFGVVEVRDAQKDGNLELQWRIFHLKCDANLRIMCSPRAAA
jgi:hypothetical protein